MILYNLYCPGVDGALMDIPIAPGPQTVYGSGVFTLQAVVPCLYLSDVIRIAAVGIPE